MSVKSKEKNGVEREREKDRTAEFAPKTGRTSTGLVCQHKQ